MDKDLQILERMRRETEAEKEKQEKKKAQEKQYFNKMIEENKKNQLI